MVKIDLNDPLQWLDFRARINSIHPNFFAILRKHHPNITGTEEKICACLMANCKSQDVAYMLGKQDAHSIDKTRSELRKKFGLKKEDGEIVGYLHGLTSEGTHNGSYPTNPA